MNASFPLASPAVSLPTVPPRTPIDAGYYDNFGVNLAAAWIYEHREWLSANTASVVLIQIRDSVSEFQRTHVGDPDDRRRGRDRLRSSWSFWDLFNVPALSTPVEGVMSASSAAMSFRNDEQIEMLSDWFRNNKGATFATTVFENPVPAALSWYLTEAEKKLINDGMDTTSTVSEKSLRPIEAKFSSTREVNNARLLELKKFWSPKPN